jgi:hypothetical protein
LALRATYWGKQRNSRFKILVDGVQVAAESMDGGGPIAFVERSYKVPPEMTKGKQFVVVRFEPEANAGAGPVFGCLMCPVET